LKDLFGLQTDTPEQCFALQLALQFQKVIEATGGAMAPGATGAR
jgi:hypothetical protein